MGPGVTKNWLKTGQQMLNPCEISKQDAIIKMNYSEREIHVHKLYFVQRFRDVIDNSEYEVFAGIILRLQL